jgi:hypothetical protein
VQVSQIVDVVVGRPPARMIDADPTQIILIQELRLQYAIITIGQALKSYGYSEVVSQYIAMYACKVDATVNKP